ncbi:hypothetical protein GQ44DRAFT_740804 [Phaeosphaeriaceae sp. PMI808]|nr:hypothetical protein GQ44DRAFT_740804 [Phaeosphaeriaceae sp. PMI808]
MQSNGDSASEGSAAQRQRSRLPVNPRRVKVAPEERKRVIRATSTPYASQTKSILCNSTALCNACNVRRVRCSGDQPCVRCRKVSRECEYPAPESDKNALKSEVERLRKRCAALEERLESTRSESTTAGRPLNHGNTAVAPLPSFRPALIGTDNNETQDGRLLIDPDGTLRYLGETSGATFLDYLKNFMLTLVPLTFQPESGDGSSFVASIGQYQTFDSRPLPNPDVDPLWLPSRTEMAAMLAELRYYIQDGNGSFSSGGIYWWGDLSSVPTSRASSTTLNTMTTDDSFRDLAYYHVCFALASCVGQRSFRLTEQHTGEAYFKRARVLLGNPLDTVRFTLSDVPVLALMAFYLIEINRRDAAYIYVGLAVRIAVMHGAFRTYTNEPITRALWTLYVLDRWLTVLMGRCPTIAEEAIKLPLPSDVATMPSCLGLRAHVELSRISGFIVCETFRIAPRKYTSGLSHASIETALNMLQNWKSQLPSSLQMPEDLSHPDPSCCILHMAHNQLIVLTTRPLFFAAVKQAVAQRVVHGQFPNEQHSQARHIQACYAASHCNLLLAQRIIQSRRKLLQAGLHFVFNAAVIQLLHRIRNIKRKVEASDSRGHGRSMLSVDDQHESNIHFAIQTFEDEARTGTNYPRDCCRVLQDLKALTDRYLASQSQTKAHIRSTTDRIHTGQQKDTTSGRNGSLGPQNSQHLLVESDSAYEEMMTWMQGNGLQGTLFI